MMASKSVGAQEVELRRERALIGSKIDAAARRVQDLRGNGHREGSPELEDALQEVRDLQSREAALPSLIAGATAKRCAMESQRLAAEQAALLPERDTLVEEARKRSNEAILARRAAAEARARLEHVEHRLDALRQRAMPYEVFVEKFHEFEHQPHKTLRLLETARSEGLLLPLTTASEENGH